VMIVHVENRDPAVWAQIVGHDRVVVEITEAPECRPLSVMAWRTDQGIGQAIARKHGISGGQGAVDGPGGRAQRVLVEGGEGVDAVVARADGQVLWGPGVIADRKHVGIDRTPLGKPLTDPLEVLHVRTLVHGGDVSLRIVAGLELPEHPARLQLLEDCADPGRRFDVATITHVMDVMLRA